MIDYKFYLQVGSGEMLQVSPIYSDNMAIEWARETNQRFYRCKLSEKLTFLGSEYDLIANADIDAKFILSVEHFINNSWLLLCKGQFYKSNCTIDYEEKTISVQPDYCDEYNDILASLDKECDVLSKPMQNSEVWLTKRPLLQLYARGDNVVSCYCGGSYYEVEAQDIVTDKKALGEKYFFSKSASFVELNFDFRQNQKLAGLAGTYVGTCRDISDKEQTTMLAKYPNSANYHILSNLIEPGTGVMFVEIYIMNTYSKILYFSKLGFNTGNDMSIEVKFYEPYYDPSTGEQGFIPTDDPIVGTFVYHEVYSRYLLDITEIDGLKTNKIASDDIVYDTKNYRYAIGYNINIATISARTSSEPTEWGLNYDNEYYLPPYGLDYRYYPFAQSKWRWASMWYYFPIEAENLEKRARKEFSIRDAYNLSEIIKALLNEFAPNIKHEATEDYSQFLYGGAGGVDLYVTQKSNIISGEYTQAARKAKTTLGQILNMLKNCFQCYWLIEGDKLRIEHIKWFKNGGSYFSDIKTIGEDLTKSECVKNGKKWTFKQSEVTFDVESMPKRYQFSWMDEVSKGFEGYPIEIMSGLVDESKTEDITISGFTSDVDFMLMNPSEISKDGFALLDCIYSDGRLVVYFNEMTVNGQKYNLQNGSLSFMAMHINFWLYDLPAWSIKVNNEISAAMDIARNKVGNVTIPLHGSVFNPNMLVKTNVGEGEVEKISINLQNKVGKATLRYETK